MSPNLEVHFLRVKVARISLLEDQLKKERRQHKEETRKLGEFVERLQKRLDDKDDEIQNLNSMIVTLDEYENLPKHKNFLCHILVGSRIHLG